MQFYFAPMEGITGYVFRNVYQKYFGCIDKYMTPFIMPNQNRCFNSREKNDVMPEHNRGLFVVPQILTNCPENFIKTAEKLKEIGYEEINLNLGCPSKTVVSKGKGAGFLAHPAQLDQFLYEVFERVSIRVSIKTRIGKDSPEEFYSLVEIFNQYPLEELIVHPRIQQDFYNNKPNYEVFQRSLQLSKNPVCYNGDIVTVQDYRAFTERFPGVKRIMVGRGLLRNPGLIGEIVCQRPLDKQTLRAFHDDLYEGYQSILFGDRNVLFKMKELWFYLIQIFSGHEKYAKKIRKAERLCAYEEAVTALFCEQEIIIGTIA